MHYSVQYQNIVKAAFTSQTPRVEDERCFGEPFWR